MVSESVGAEDRICIALGSGQSYLAVRNRVKRGDFIGLDPVVVIAIDLFWVFLQVQFGLASLSRQVSLGMLLEELINGINRLDDLGPVLVSGGLSVLRISVNRLKPLLAVPFDDLFDDFNTLALIRSPAEGRRRWDRSMCCRGTTHRSGTLESRRD